MTLLPTHSPELSYVATPGYQLIGIWEFSLFWAAICLGKNWDYNTTDEESTNIRGQLAVSTTMLFINNDTYLLNIWHQSAALYAQIYSMIFYSLSFIAAVFRKVVCGLLEYFTCPG